MTQHSKAPLCDLCLKFIRDVRTTPNVDLDTRGGSWEQKDPVLKAACRKACPFRGTSPWFDDQAPLYRHHNSFEALMDSAKECRLCDLLCQQFQQGQRGIDENLPIQLKVFNHNSPWNVTFSAYAGGRALNFDIYYRDDLKARAASRDFRKSLPPYIPPGRTISWHAKSVGCKDLALIWLQECLSKHKSCRVEKEAPLPKRVIDVGPPDGTEEPVLFISSGQAAHYIALSYCWGDPTAMLTTTLETLTARMQGIPLASLPRTLQDAVWVTRALNTRYLWIDALCIVQDSIEDWIGQSSIMGHIFGGAMLTISAAGAEGSQSGFLHERLSVKNDICCKINADPASEYDIHVRPEQLAQFGDSRIERRAWTMQERLLSRRVLHYGKDRIGWECPDNSEVEGSGPGKGIGFSVNNMTEVLLSPSNTKHITPGVRVGNSTMSTGSQGWDEIIQQFASRGISKESDRLPALASIAERYSARMTYLAGIWDELLPRALMWRPIESATRPAANRVPSWSWASIEGAITYNQVYDLGGSGTEWHSEVLSASVQDSGPRYMGQVSGGEILISGPLTKAFYAPPDPTETSGQLLDEEGTFGTEGNEAWMDTNSAVASECCCLWIGNANGIDNTKRPGNARGLGSARGLGNTRGLKSHSYGLLLREVGTSGGVFRRCGVAKLSQEEASGVISGAGEQTITLI
ncbi:hypothetical protein FGG08_005686 [Glutinoglossum americanum]|uniref:Heterokaryon incompatibility domain-containing protein n=1 Tax=Glutinoglossum americanum TaxID=1670608 RepID=A0A9P8I336_9PEZI|nr:hypothetical protein FGG08_005686 [Glutinoglossum americanum]